MKKSIFSKRICFKAATALLAFSLALAVPMSSVNRLEVSADQAAVDEAERKLNELKEKQRELENQVNSLTSTANDIKTTVANLDSLSSALSVEIYNLSVQIEEKETQIAQKEADIVALTQVIGSLNESILATQLELSAAQETEVSQYSAMKLRIQYMYENGDDTYLDMLFKSEDMSDFLNKADYIAEISAYDREQLKAYALTRDTINELLGALEDKQDVLSIHEAKLEMDKQGLESDRAILLTYKEQNEVQKASYDTVIAAKNNELSNVQSQINSTSDAVAAAKQEVADQQAIWEAAKAEYAAWLAAQAANDAKALIAAKLAEINIKGFTWPLPGYNIITSEYGNRMHPVLHIPKLHDGMDISGANVNGKPIVAAYSGTVVLSEYYYGYGECVKIDHGGSVQTLYAHMSARLVSVGQHVNAGDTIGLVGSTGNSTGPHLHLSIIIGGEFLNPRDYFVIP